MKYLNFFFLFVSFVNAQNVQEPTDNIYVKQIWPQQQMFLNNGSKSRNYLEVNLPANTIEWYFSFSTSEDEASKKSLDLFTKVSMVAATAFATGGTGIAAATSIANKIEVPPGSAAIDVYILDGSNVNKFLNKSDKWYNGSDNYSSLASFPQRKQGKFPVVNYTSGTYYIGLCNTATLNSVNVSIEVVAIARKKSLDELGREQKATQKKRQQEEANQKLTESLTNFANAFKKEEPKPLNPEQQKGLYYGNLGWKSYENGNVDKCIEHSNKALEFDNTLGWVKTNLGLCYLQKGEESKATDYYIEAIPLIKNNKKDAKRQFDEAIKDIKDAQQINPNLKGAKEILDLLQDERKKM